MKGLCALSPTSDKALLAFPVSGEVSAVQNTNISSSGLGRVQIVDLANPDNQPITIVAHDTKLSCLQMNIQKIKTLGELKKSGYTSKKIKTN